MSTFRKVCVFAGSSQGTNVVYQVAARELGAALARAGIGVVYGGGRIGLMGVLADAALEAGGHVIGVIPRGLATRELAHDRISEMRVVSSMHERKALMAELSDAFVALPGGLGTLEELFEVVTWAQLGIHGKPIGVLNVEGYYDPLLAFVDHTVSQGFVRAEDRQLIRVSASPVDLLDLLRLPAAAVRRPWINASES
jgi:uncharacterized protein (TIGR00730 family)